MRIHSVEAFVIDLHGDGAECGPGGPAVAVKVLSSNGLCGWGESGTVAGAGVVASLVHDLLKPLIERMEFRGRPEEIVATWQAMYDLLRFSGHSAGFVLDAMAAVDMALWDLGGKILRRRLSGVLPASRDRGAISAWARIPPASTAEMLETAVRFHAAGIGILEIGYRGTAQALRALDAIRAALGSAVQLAVHAGWAIRPNDAAAFTAELQYRGVAWLSSPFPPEEARQYEQLASASAIPIAAGEACRMTREFTALLDAGVRVLRINLGRCGITEVLRLVDSSGAVHPELVFDVGAGVGPLLGASVQFAAAIPNCAFVQHNPLAERMMRQFACSALNAEGGRYVVPDAPGLGLVMDEPEICLCQTIAM